jgi:hypothetical protein
MIESTNVAKATDIKTEILWENGVSNKIEKNLRFLHFDWLDYIHEKHFYWP